MASTEPMDDAASARSLVPLLPALEVASKAEHHKIFSPRASPRSQGVAAGGLGAQFRAGLTGDMAASKRATQAQAGMLDYLKDSAGEDLRFGSGRAEEANSLSSLLLDRDKINLDSDLSGQKRRMESQLAQSQRDAESKAADMQRKSRTSQSILGLFGLA